MPRPSEVTFRRESKRLGALRLFPARRSTAIRWGAIAVLVIALLMVMQILPMEHIFGRLRSWIDGLGIWGPLVFGLFYIVATLLFVPGSILTLAAGAIYGLGLGTVIASLSSTTGAALAFLIARYLARDYVRSAVERSTKLAAVDKAIGDEGWKIVALLRLSPVVPFNLQNYLYGVTAIRFWPYVFVSWVAMLPGAFLYVYVGSLGHTVATQRETTPAEWVLRGVGLLATIAVTISIARLARRAIHTRADIESDGDRPAELPTSDGTILDGDQQPTIR